MPKKRRNIFTFFCFWYDITFSLFNGSKYLKEQNPHEKVSMNEITSFRYTITNWKSNKNFKLNKG